jgi:hypothetical protein
MSDGEDDESKRERFEREAFAGDDDRDGEPAQPAGVFSAFLPSWWDRLMAYDERTLKAWDERVRRIKLGIATDTDVRVQDAAVAALERGKELDAEARRMPREHAKKNLAEAERAVSLGVPPLIAEAICDGKLKETRSTRACSRVGADYTVLVLIGERGCGKTYAAADWLINTQHRVPNVLAKRVSVPRFLEASMIVEVPFEERTPKYGLARALVLDDLGTEAKDFMTTDLAALLVQRYRNALPTVITTNLSEKDFSERYGMRFADRMKEVGRFVVVSNDPGDSLRGKE